MKHKEPMRLNLKKILVTLAICFALFISYNSAYGQKPSVSTSPSKEVSRPLQTETPLDDPLGRSTPQGAVLGFIKSVDKEDYERAVEYLDTKQPPKRAQQLAEELKAILDWGFSGNAPKLSNKAEGELEDGLKSNRERIGVIKTSTGNYDIILERVQRGTDPQVWLFSSETLKLLPEIHRDFEYDRIEQYVPKFLRDKKLLHYPIWRWIGVILLILFAWFITWIIIVGHRFIYRRFTKEGEEQDIKRLKGPIAVLALSLGSYIASLLSYALLSSLFFIRVSETLAIIGITWFCLCCVDPIANRLLRRRESVVSSGKIALARLLNKIIKVIIIIIGATFIFYMANFNLTAVITGLGVGGIAVAFAAQKTLENLFGGVMIISDQPIRVGDFCRAGDFQGTVEDIGLRSTQLRTLNRTVVSIPNGQLATMSLENFSVRDKILFRHKLQLRYETSADQLRFVIAGIRRILYEHPKVETVTARIRFTGLQNSSLELDVFAYIQETEYERFLAIQEDLLLRLTDIVEKSGTTFAFPSQTTYFARDGGLDRKKSEEAAETVNAWRKQGVLPFPDFMPADVAEFENKLEYPEPGSVSHKKQ
jgi:MscS family membrane protein